MKVGVAVAIALLSCAIVTLAAAFSSPWWAMSLPLMAWGGLLLSRLRHPLAAPVLVTVGTLALAGNTPGITVQEVAFVSLYGLYLVWFYATRVLGLGHLGAPYAGDKAMLLFLVSTVLSVGLTIVHQGDLREMANSLGAVSVVGLYFPIREACVRHRWGLAAMTASVLAACAAIALGNVIQYRALVEQAVLAEFVAGRRVSVNDFYLGAGFVLSLSLVMRSTSRLVILAGVGLLALFAAALVATQARGQWITCSVSAAALFTLGGHRGRLRLMASGVVLVAAAAVAVPLLMGDKTSVLLNGMLQRFLSIGTASSKDLSFLSRFVEASEALPYILKTPVLGHGLGVAFPHFDVITQAVWWTTFIHIGYVGIVYTYGLWGAACLLTVWGGALRRGLRASRALPELLEGTVGLGATAFFTGMIVLMTVSNAFVTADGLFVFASMAALAAGAHARTPDADVRQGPAS